jgi:hypothetical protein
MADARRSSRLQSPPTRLASVVVHPAHLSAELDSDGFCEVHIRRRWRRPPKEEGRPVPADLVGKCFNFFATNHVCANCRQPGMLQLSGVGAPRTRLPMATLLLPSRR